MIKIILSCLIVVALGWGDKVLGCTEIPENISAGVKPQPAEVFKSISHFMLLSAIFDTLGPAVRDAGIEGRHIFEWPVEGGRVFFVVTGEGCGKPYEVGYR